MKYLSLLLVVGMFASCASIEIIPGLCYNDRDGTYLCPEPEPECDPDLDSSATNFCIDEYIDPPMSEPDFDCEIWREHSDPEAYLNCILIAER
jgi:hypothetical protein